MILDLAMISWVWHKGCRKKKKVDKLAFNKMKNSCVSKGTINRVKRPSMEWEKILISVYLIRDYYAECIETPTKKSSNSIQKLAKDLTRWFSKEDIQMVNKHMQKCSTILFIRKMQIEITLMYLFTSVRITASTSVGKDADLYEVSRVIIMETKSKMILARN